MNAPTAAPAAITKMTSSTATAGGVNSGMAQRIDSFFKEKLAAANSDAFSGLKRSAEQAAAHGFTNCANSRYADFLEAFRDVPDLARHYTDAYPQCCFLPWKALRSVKQSLQLWCDLPKHYTGAIPPEQLPWLDVFALDSDDSVSELEILEIMDVETVNVEAFRGLIRASADVMEADGRPLPAWLRESDWRRDAWMRSQASLVRPYLRQFRESFFVVAPPEAFNTTMDFAARFRELVLQAQTQPNTPPDDPLVIRFVRGGALVVAAWGDEAKELNAMTRELRL